MTYATHSWLVDEYVIVSGHFVPRIRMHTIPKNKHKEETEWICKH